MGSLQETKETIKFYEKAIKNAQEMIKAQIENDIEFQIFYAKLKSISPDYGFIFYDHNLKFAMYKMIHDGAEHKSINYFEINSNGEIVYTENSFDNIEEIAKEAQKIVSKFL
ncbi:MAG: hypothetical protein PHX44_09810 [Sulfurimonas sp.]|uniref:hypothetical protein n=1 Tax=Sulfurimonas sp. TaxID=2022749 RepID=UPI002607C477|nr:hypothetical protein [Sulfurimonas sp.]MDD2653327.1 hypothetical protein [Sulfurimonas sp.]MDD3450696.1 hypothetical protein [Sulfurimonas sp.]